MSKSILGKPERGKCDECSEDTVVVLVRPTGQGGGRVCWRCIQKAFGMGGGKLPDWDKFEQMGG